MFCCRYQTWASYSASVSRQREMTVKYPHHSIRPKRKQRYNLRWANRSPSVSSTCCQDKRAVEEVEEEVDLHLEGTAHSVSPPLPHLAAEQGLKNSSRSVVGVNHRQVPAPHQEDLISTTQYSHSFLLHHLLLHPMMGWEGHTQVSRGLSHLRWVVVRIIRITLVTPINIQGKKEVIAGNKNHSQLLPVDLYKMADGVGQRGALDRWY